MQTWRGNDSGRRVGTRGCDQQYERDAFCLALDWCSKVFGGGSVQYLLNKIYFLWGRFSQYWIPAKTPARGALWKSEPAIIVFLHQNASEPS